MITFSYSHCTEGKAEVLRGRVTQSSYLLVEAVISTGSTDLRVRLFLPPHRRLVEKEGVKMLLSFGVAGECLVFGGPSCLCQMSSETGAFKPRGGPGTVQRDYPPDAPQVWYPGKSFLFLGCLGLSL